MPLQIIRQDITKLPCDAIVNAANSSLLGGGGVDGAIHRAAGPRLLAECRTLGGCPTGEAKITKGYDLPCKYVIHTVGPIWNDGSHGERALLESCYRSSLALAEAHGCESVAFPLISAGAYGYPKDQAIRVAVDTIGDFLAKSDADMLVYLVVFGHGAFQLSSKLYSGVQSYIDAHYVDAHTDYAHESRRERWARLAALRNKAADEEAICFGAAPSPSMRPPAAGAAMHAPMSDAAPVSGKRLEDAVRQIDESFSQMLLRKIDEKGMKDAECYKKANVDRKLFSKIRGNPLYKVSKPTAIAFAVALELPPEEARELLQKAGFALSHSNLFDVIVEYFIENGNYDVLQINEALFSYDQSLLGGQ